MSDKVTVYGKVTLEFTLHEIYVEDALDKESVEAKVSKVIGDHLGIHDYTWRPKWATHEVRIVVDDWESA